MANKINYNLQNIAEASNMPKMSLAFDGWADTITLIKITQDLVDFDVVLTREEIVFSGVVQPLSQKSINLKPEGQRAFQWYQVHCYSGALNLSVNDKVILDNKDYKLMAIYNYSRNGFVEYHLVEDFS